MRGRTIFIAAAVTGSLILGACGSDSTDEPAATTAAAAATVAAPAPTEGPAPTEVAAAADIVDTAVAAGSFKTLAAALGAAGLVDTLKGDGPFTVFAPTDDAFAALPAGLVDALLKPENKATLVQILTYHVVAGKVLAADVTAGPVETVEGSEATISTDGGVKIDGANVVATDIMASNGVIHVIDAVLVPKGVDAAALLAPAPAATDAPKTTDVAASADIVDTAVAAGSFNTLAAALGAAGLVDTLKGDGPFTVFAPTDDAFAALPAGLVEKLLLPANKDVLVKILTYHVVAGKVLAADVKAGPVKTVEGSEATITIDGGVKIDKANVVTTDVMATNGVIHVIDAVLVPADVDVTKL
jgi:transforming growth factor-beta-induced protein